MNFIEQQIRLALAEQLHREGLDIPDSKVDRLAENVCSALGLTEFSCEGERWWATRYYALEEV